MLSKFELLEQQAGAAGKEGVLKLTSVPTVGSVIGVGSKGYVQRLKSVLTSVGSLGMQSVEYTNSRQLGGWGSSVLLSVARLSCRHCVSVPFLVVSSMSIDARREGTRRIA